MGNYKLSKYNFFKREKNKVIGVNLFNKRMFAIDTSLYDKLLLHKNDLKLLEESDPILFSTMYKLGVIENDSIDIPSILLMRNRECVYSNKNCRLIILPTLNCNFSCWYCYETRVKKMMNEETIDKVKKYIRQLIVEERIKTLQLDWFGGEPLLGFEKVIKPIVIETKHLCEQHNVQFAMSMTSNGFLITDEIVSFFKQHNMAAAQITLDGNEEIHNQIRFHGKQKKQTYKTIVENICKMAKVMHVILRINYTKVSIGTCTDVINLIPESVRKNIEVNLVQVWQDRAQNIKEERAYMSEMEIETNKIFKEAGFNTQVKQINSRKMYTCYADLKNSATINYDGRVFKCTATNFDESTEDGILTEERGIIWDEQRISKRLARATFDNKYCLVCQYLPICTGLCSNKPPLINNKCILKKKYKSDILGLMEIFDKHDYKIAHLNRI